VAGRNAAVDALLSAETLIEEFIGVAPGLRAPLPADVTAAIGQLQHIYPEIWANLDRAHALLDAQVPGYAELRARQPKGSLGVTSSA
jgi:hypothetical protein